MGGGGVAVADQQGVAIEPAGAAIGAAEQDGIEPQAAQMGAEHAATRQDGDAGLADGLRQGALGGGAEIEHHLHLHPGGGEVEGGEVGAVAGGGDDHMVAHLHAVAQQVVARGAGQHHARSVVVGEKQWAFDGTGGEHHAGGADLPEAFAGEIGVRGGEMVGDAFGQAGVVVRVEAEGGGARHDADVRHGRQFGEAAGQEFASRDAIHQGADFGEQGAAGFGLFVAQDDALTFAAGGQGGGEAGGAGADDEDIAMVVVACVAVRVWLGGGVAQAGAAAEQGFEEAVPELPAAWAEHGLVEEPGRQQRGGQGGECAEIGAERGPAVLAGGFQALVEFDLGGAQVGGGAAAVAPQGDQGVRFLGAGGEDAAGAVVFEGAADQVDAVGEQGGGERVSLAAQIVHAIEAEAEVAGALDAAAGFGAHGIRHQPALEHAPDQQALHHSFLAGGADHSGRASPALLSGRASPARYVARMRSLTVSRRALKKRPQPWMWRQRSATVPRGLSRW